MTETVIGTDVVETELRTLLANSGGDYVKAYEKLVEAEASKELAVIERSNSEGRKGAWRTALAKKDRATLREAYDRLRGYVAKARSNAPIITQEPSVLTQSEARSLMEQFVDLRKIETMVKADREAIKERVIASMTESLAEQGEEFPEYVNASVDVPELGMKFCREGTGRKDPEINIIALRAALGEDLFNQVTTKQVKTTYSVDIDRLMQQAADPASPIGLEHIRKSLSVGDWKSPSFTARELK